MIGEKYNRWTTISEPYKKDGDKHSRNFVLCRCDCGTIRELRVDQLKSNTSKSCGCWKREVAAKHLRELTQKHNTYKECGDIIQIIDSKDNVIIIDKDDFDKVKDKYFYIAANGYAFCGRGRIRLHRLLMGFPDKKYVVDHINGSPADNRKCNLRICTQKDNARNTSKGMNVQQCSTGSWVAKIMVDGKSRYLGRYKTKEEALKAKADALEKYFGDFSPTRRNEVK